MLRLTLDTCILTSAFRSRRGPAYQLLDKLYQGRFAMPTSYALFLEYESVLKRAGQRAAHGFSFQTLDAFLDDLSKMVDQVQPHYKYRPFLPDPNDDMVLEAALNGASHAIVTYDVRHFLPATKRFGLRIVTPASIIREERL